MKTSKIPKNSKSLNKCLTWKSKTLSNFNKTTNKKYLKSMKIIALYLFLTSTNSNKNSSPLTRLSLKIFFIKLYLIISTIKKMNQKIISIPTLNYCPTLMKLLIASLTKIIFKLT